VPGAFDGLKQLTDIAHPKILRRLLAAGTLTPRSPIAVAAAFPWLLGRGPSLGIITQMNAVTIGAKPALHDRRGTLTWKELEEGANRCAQALGRAGLKGGDKVALLLRNGREMAEVALGAQKTGIIACPLNTWAKTKELSAVAANVAPDMLVYDTAHTEQAAAATAAAPSNMILVHVGDDSKALPGSLAFDELVEGCSARPPAPLTRQRGSAKIVIQTSGTTGTPKGAERDSSAAGLGALANLLGSVPYRRDDVILCPAPMFHSFGLATFTFATALGATMVLPEKFDPERSLQLIEEHRVTAASFVPVMIRRIVSLPQEVRHRYDLASLRIVLASGSVLSQDLKRAAGELFGEVLYDLYGSTEAGWVAIATPDSIRARPGSVGHPVDGVEVAVFSGDGQRLGVGATGELHIKSDLVFDGYTSGDSKADRDGYMAIGDLGRFDEEGYLFVESRTDDMVVIGGENVYPIEVEEVIESIAGVEEVTVLGLPDEEYGQVLAAFVVGSVDPEEITEQCKKELASYKVPRRVEVVTELPRTSTGKVLKRELIEQLA
jgi:fatty-acyl-CoA synthase